jgi:hypothetical protein
MSSGGTDASGRVNSWRRSYIPRISGENFGYLRESPGVTATRCAKCSGVTILKKKPHGKKKIS